MPPKGKKRKAETENEFQKKKKMGQFRRNQNKGNYMTLTAAQVRYSKDVSGDADLLKFTLMDGYTQLNNDQIERVKRMILDILTIVRPPAVRDYQQKKAILITAEEWNKLENRSDTHIHRVIKEIQKFFPMDPSAVYTAIQIHLDWLQQIRYLKQKHEVDLKSKKEIVKVAGYDVEEKRKVMDHIEKVEDIYKNFEVAYEKSPINALNAALDKSGDRIHKQFPMDSSVMQKTDEKTATIFVDNSLLPPIITDKLDEIDAKILESDFDIKDESYLLDEINKMDNVGEEVRINTDLLLGSATVPVPLADQKLPTGMPASQDPALFHNLQDLDENSFLDPLGVMEHYAQEINVMENQNKNINDFINEHPREKNLLIQDMKNDVRELQAINENLIKAKEIQFKQDFGNHYHKLGVDVKHIEDISLPSQDEIASFFLPPPPLSSNIIPIDESKKNITVTFSKPEAEQINTEIIRVQKIKDIACAKTPQEGQLIAIRTILGCQ